MHFYGSASAEPFFAACFPGERGSTTAHLRRLPREGRAGGAYKTLLKHRVQGAALPAMLPSSPSADYISVCTFAALLRQSRFFVAPFPENWGARLRISGGCPARGEPEALIDLCSSIACRAQPCQRCSPVLQALIIFQYALLRLCFGRAVFLLPLSRRTGEHDCASPAVAPQGASRRRLLIFAQASRAKTKGMGLRLFCKLFMNPIDKVGE